MPAASTSQSSFLGAISRGVHAVIEAGAGFFARTRTSVGDRVALREAQPVRPARDVASSRPEVVAVPDAVRDAARESVRDAIYDLDASSDPWDIGSDNVAPAEPRETSASPVLPLPPPAPPAPVPPHTEQAADVRPGNAPLRPPRERKTARAASSVLQRMPAGGVDLASLIARKTPLDWFEAVAIAQELHAALLRNGSPETTGVPELSDIAITAEGDIVMLAAGPAGEQPVAGAARVLLALLGDGQSLPVQLRLLVLQEVSPSPVCRSVLEFSTRLALFERPGRNNAIREVYERFNRLPPAQAGPPVHEAAPDAGAARVEVIGRPRRKVLVAAVAPLLIVAAGVAAALVWSTGAASPQRAADARGSLSRAAAEARASVSEAAARGARAVAKLLGADSGAQPTAPAPAQTAATPAGPPAPPARRRAVRPSVPAAQPAPPAPQPAATAPVAAAAPAPDMTVYTSANTDVIPPKLLRSRLPAEPGAGLPAESLPEVELLVSSSGDVESVRLVTPQSGVRSAMMLSAIKSWRFDPATLNAQPVRYRLLMRLPNQ